MRSNTCRRSAKALTGMAGQAKPDGRDQVAYLMSC